MTQEISDVPAGWQPSPQAEIHLHKNSAGNLFRRLWQRKLALALLMAFGTGLGVVLAYGLTPEYSSEAVVGIDMRKRQVVEVSSVLSDLPMDRNIMWGVVWGEVERLQSWPLSLDVVKVLRLTEDPEFNPAAAPATSSARDWLPLAMLRQWFEAAIAQVSGLARSMGVPTEPAMDEAGVSPQLVQIVAKFQSHLRVWPDRNSGLIHVAFASSDRDKAPRIVDKLVATYLDQKVAKKYDDTKHAIDWLTTTVHDLHGRVVAAERAVEAFRSEANLVTARGDNLTDQEMAELNKELTTAEASGAEIASRLNEVKAALSNQEVLQNAPDVLASPVIQTLRSKEADQSVYASQLLTTYGQAHPLVQQVTSQLKDIRAKIREEVGRIVSGLASQKQAADVRTSSLRRQLAALEVASGDLKKSEIRLHELEREADANREVYSSFLLRLNELATQLDVQTPDASVVVPPAMPVRPSFPNKMLIIALAFIASAGIGLFWMLLRETYAPGFRNLEEVERFTGRRGLGIVPFIGNSPSRLARSASPRARLRGKVYVEAIRGIRTSLLARCAVGGSRIVLITSAIPHEGKTSLALLLARLSAQGGQRVLLIDCDQARPSLHTRLGEAETQGLADVIDNGLSPFDAVRTDDLSAAHFMFAGRGSRHPTDLLDSRGMGELLDMLRRSYDLIILDASPVLPVPDARILARHADQTLFLVQWRKTPQKLVVDAVRKIAEDSRGDIGMVLSQVDLRTYAQYDCEAYQYSVDYARTRSTFDEAALLPPRP